jgi:DNA-binding beta-propeller fold protein YncE
MPPSLALLAVAFATAAAHSGAGITVGPEGRVYFADTAHDIVWRIEPDGGLTEVAAGVHTNILFIAPDRSPYYPPSGYPPGDYSFLTTAPDGGAYATLHGMVVKIMTDGSQHTLAGDETYGFRDGPAQSARFDRPQGLAVDSSGVVYVADHGNRRVRVIRPDGVVSTLTRSGWPWAPSGVVVHQGQVYVLERLGKYWGFPGLALYLRTVMDHPRVRVIDPAGEARVIAAVPVEKGLALFLTAAVLAILAAVLALAVFGLSKRAAASLA